VARDLYKWIATLLVLLLVVVLLRGQLSFVITATFFGIFAMSWSFFTGFSGYLNLGHVIFCGLAGYTSAILNYHLGWPLWLCLVLGVVVGTLGGWLYLNPIHKRITGLSFEMVSFLTIVALSNLVASSIASPVTGGNIGLSPLDGIYSSVGLAAGLAVLLCAMGFLFTWFLRSNSGKVIEFAKEDKTIVRHAGADPHQYTGRLLLWSGLAASIGGVLYVHYSGAAVVSNTFALAFMIRIVVMAIIGGRFDLRGSILGAYLVVFLGMELMPHMDAYAQYLIIYGIGFVIYFLVPRGLISLLEVPWRYLSQSVRLTRRVADEKSNV